MWSNVLERESHRTVKDEIFITQTEGLQSLTGECFSESPSGSEVYSEKCCSTLGGLDHLTHAKERLLSNQHHQQAKHKDDSIDSFQGPFHHPPNLLTWLSLQGDCKTSQKWVPSRCVCPLAL